MSYIHHHQVRDYIRNGRGWSQPDVARRSREEAEDRRKLPRYQSGGHKLGQSCGFKNQSGIG